MSDQSDFRPVTFQKEREKILSDLQSRSVQVLGVAEDGSEFQFNVRKIEGNRVHAEALAPMSRGLREDETMQLVFGLADGQYLVRTKVEKVINATCVFDFSSEIFRLQRRNNFRTPIPRDGRISFRIRNINNAAATAAKAEFTPIDLSAGGLRISWPQTGLPEPKMDDQISGLLSLPGQRQIEVFCSTKSIVPVPHGFQVGLEFRNLSNRDEQAILFVCLQIHRTSYPLIR